MLNSIFGQGGYELVDKFKFLEVPHSQWIRVNPEQRKVKISDIDATISSSPSTVFETFEISVNDSRIDHVGLERASRMWEKAEELINTEGFILPAAGAPDTARQVASLTAKKSGKGETPHYVHMQKCPVGVEVKCDSFISQFTEC